MNTPDCWDFGGVGWREAHYVVDVAVCLLIGSSDGHGPRDTENVSTHA